MTHRTFEQQMELLQKEQKGLLPPKVLEESSEEKAKPETGTRRFLGIAWGYCNRGDYRRAIEIFTTLSSDPAIRWEARYGLAMCYARAKDTRRAIPLLEELVERKLHLRDTLPTLLALLVEEKDYSKAATYVTLLTGGERRRWEEAVHTGALSAALERAKATGDLEALTELIRTHSEWLDKCQSPEVFLEAANLLLGTNDSYAIETYKRLLASCPQKWDFRLGILYALKSVLPPADTLLELDQEGRRTNLDPAYRTQLTELRVSVLRDQLAAAPPNAPEVVALANAILALKPEDRSALTTLAWWRFNHGQYSQAADGFATLARRYPEEPDYPYGLANALVKLKRVDEALALVSQLKARDARFVALETDLKVAVLGDQLATAPPNAPEVEHLAREILKLKPDDKGALATLAWWRFNHGQYSQAADGFATLARRYPEEPDYPYGLANALVKLKRVDEALALVSQLKARDARFVALETDILMEKALAAFKDTRYTEAERYLEYLLARRPDNLDIKKLLAWSIHNQGRGNDALPLFLSLFHIQEDPAIADTILGVYATSRDRRGAVAFADSLALSDKQELKKVAGDFFFKNGYPVRAAVTYRDLATSYYNADTPSAELATYDRERSGTKGQSRLTEYTFPFGLSYPLPPDTEVGLTLTTHHLSSGDVPPNPFVGSAFSGIPQQHEFTNSASVVTPEIKLAKDGFEKSYSLVLGTTPLGGTIAPLPTFFARIDKKDWNLSIHQSPVKDSILSYIGAQDPFSDSKWGRVVRTGIDGELVATQIAPYWLSLKGGYDFYYGKNVIDNHAYRATIALGRTFITETWTISPGMHVTAQHFEQNTDFFTFGHGGYFSPDTHYILGPFVNLQRKQGDSFIVEGQFGINYFRARSDSAPVDPLERSTQARFPGSSSSGLGFATNLKGQILLGNHWALGGTVEANKTADFTEVKAGINLHYFFEPRSKLLQRDTIFR